MKVNMKSQIDFSVQLFEKQINYSNGGETHQNFQVYH